MGCTFFSCLGQPRGKFCLGLRLVKSCAGYDGRRSVLRKGLEVGRRGGEGKMFTPLTSTVSREGSQCVFWVVPIDLGPRRGGGASDVGSTGPSQKGTSVESSVRTVVPVRNSTRTHTQGLLFSTTVDPNTKFCRQERELVLENVPLVPVPDHTPLAPPSSL